MPFDLDKIMFEVYKEATYSGKYRVVYFTELQDHNKEAEINRAMAGEHFFDGFIRAYRKDQAKETIEKLLNRLNAGEAITTGDFERELKPFTPSSD
jgi:type I restriction-modification system DNA methylase subunit